MSYAPPNNHIDNDDSYEMLPASTPGPGLGDTSIRLVSESSHYDEDDSHGDPRQSPAPVRSSGLLASSGDNEQDPMMLNFNLPTFPTLATPRGVSGEGTHLTGGHGGMYGAEDSQRRFFGSGSPGPDEGIGIRDSLQSGSFTPLGSVPLMAGNDTDHDSAAALNKETSSSFNDGVGAKQRKRDRILDSYARTDENKSRRRIILIGGALLGLIILGLAIAVPVVLTSHKKTSNNVTSGNGGGGGGGGNGGGGSGEGSPPLNAPTTGGNGSTVITDKNATFTYYNPFGGFWVEDIDDPFNMNAQAQSWVPPLNQSWDWEKNRVFGVNLGGWLVLEPFITPAYYEKYNGTKDEWTLSEAIINDPNSGGLEAFLEKHYDTFITEEDFAQIAGAGLSWVRIPLPFWGVETRYGEPFLPKVAWKYFLKAVQWARKYGIRIKLDLHTMPGSQNGYNHSGRLGLINWLNGVMGIANAQRGLDYIRVITEFISQPEYGHIELWGFVNEAVVKTIGKDIISHFYLEVHNVVRNITGFGAGKGPYISFHDGFQGTGAWAGYMSGADRLILDSHPYLCFTVQDPSPLSEQVDRPCKAWAKSFNTSLDQYGVTVAGEWSLSFNDCGKWVNGIGLGTRWEGTFPGYSGPTGGSCAPWIDWPNYDAETKQSIYKFAQATMDALPHWFFWTWKIHNSSETGKVEAPMWSYQLGLQQGWIPKDPRSSIGYCNKAGVNAPWSPPFKPWQTGGAGAGTVDPAFVASFGAWPPESLSGVSDVRFAPTYTATGPVPTLPPPVYTLRNGSTISGGSGWFNKADKVGAPVNISGCSYPDPYAQTPILLPTTTCGGGTGSRRRAPPPLPRRTQPPAI